MPIRDQKARDPTAPLSAKLEYTNRDDLATLTFYKDLSGSSANLVGLEPAPGWRELLMRKTPCDKFA